MTWFHTLLPQPTTQMCNCFCCLCSNHESITCQVKDVQGQLKLMHFTMMALLAPVKADASCAFQPQVVSFSVPWAFVWDKTSKEIHFYRLCFGILCLYRTAFSVDMNRKYGITCKKGPQMEYIREHWGYMVCIVTTRPPDIPVFTGHLNIY